MHTLMRPRRVNPPPAKRRVLIVDDHNFFAACLRTLLDNESDLTVCDIMTNSVELGARVERLQPDLLVIDLSLGTENGLELGRRLRAMHIETPILFTSSVAEPTRTQLAGVSHCAFVAKGRKAADFLAALRAVLAPDEEPSTNRNAGLALRTATAKA